MLKRIFVIVLLVIVLPVTLFWVVNLLRERTAEPGVFVDETEQNVADPDSIVGAVIDKEKLLREINPLLSRLNRAVLDLRLLNEDTYSVFCDSFVGRDAVEFALSAGPINDWHTREVETGKPLEIDARQRVDGLWAALIKPIQFFEQGAILWNQGHQNESPAAVVHHASWLSGAGPNERRDLDIDCIGWRN